MNLNKIIQVSEDTLATWQCLLDIMAESFLVPAALIMKINLPDIEVFLSSRSKGNPYKTGDSECLLGSGLYCERVFETKSKLLVPNALKDKEWDNNPDIKLNMVSYIGFPILWPDDEVFGTICLLDLKENSYNEECCNALMQFKGYIEDYLSLQVSIFLKSDREEIIKKEIQCDKSFSSIEKILLNCV